MSKPTTEVATVESKRQFAPIAVRKGTLRPRDFPEMIAFAKALASSSMVPKDFQGRVGDVIVAIQMGGEVGLSPMAALQNIAVINGRPSLWGDALLGLVQAHPECEDVVEELDEKTMTATCTIKRRGRTPTVRTFSMEDAKTAKLWGKAGPWTQYPKRMLQMRARGFAVRDAFPDALRGMYVAEEAMDITPPPSAAPLSASDFEELPEAAVKAEASADEPAPSSEVEGPEPPADEGPKMPASDGATFAKALKIKGGQPALTAICEKLGREVPDWLEADREAVLEAIREAKAAKS